MALIPANFLNSRCQLTFNAAGQITSTGKDSPYIGASLCALTTAHIACNVLPNPGWSPKNSVYVLLRTVRLQVDIRKVEATYSVHRQKVSSEEYHN